MRMGASESGGTRLCMTWRRCPKLSTAQRAAESVRGDEAGDHLLLGRQGRPCQEPRRLMRTLLRGDDRLVKTAPRLIRMFLGSNTLPLGDKGEGREMPNGTVSA